MSAFFCEKNTIDDVVTLMLEHDQVKVFDPDEMGKNLWLMNSESVFQRYSHHEDEYEAHRKRCTKAEGYWWEDRTWEVSEEQRIFSLHCLTYQSCEGNVETWPLYQRLKRLEDRLPDTDKLREIAAGRGEELTWSYG